MSGHVPDLKIISIGKVKDRNLQLKIEDYIGRIRHDARLELIELKDDSNEKENAKISELIERENGYVFALSEDGKEYGSSEFARRIESINRRIVFIIGGPFGLNPTVKKSASEILSLSRFTFPHDIARLLLFEQIYRSLSIIRNRNYHKE